MTAGFNVLRDSNYQVGPSVASEIQTEFRRIISVCRPTNMRRQLNLQNDKMT